FEQQIQEIRDTLPGKGKEDEIVNYVLECLAGFGRSTHACLYLVDEETHLLRLRGERGEELSLPVAFNEAPLLEALTHHAKPLILESLEREILERVKDRNRPAREILVQFLHAIHAQVALPFFQPSGALMGVLGLRAQGLEEAYSSSEIRLLATL